MFSAKKPYLIIPKLIEQPTWGGDYIIQTKNWQYDWMKNKKIGQSYELFSGSKLLLQVTDSTDEQFIPEFGFADKPDTTGEHFSFTPDQDYVTLEDIVSQNPQELIGGRVNEKYGKMPLLIKINHAAGNSFQLHIRYGESHPYWKPKPESWYYFEDGLVTFGIREGINIEEYKQTCLDIDTYMHELSINILSKNITLQDAKKMSKEYIQEKNPWQFVNRYQPKKYELIDLSMGAIHHSWEEDNERFPNGNILYEVQQDVMDPISTIRSFDQGKIKEDGTVRQLNIEDYFKIIDTDPQINNVSNALRLRQGNKMLETPYYSMDILEVADTINDHTDNSFVHLNVRDGAVEVQTPEGMVHLTKGHSAFIPYAVGDYKIINKSLENSVILKTYIK